MQQAVAHWDRLVAQEVQWLEVEVEAEEAEEVQPFLARVCRRYRMQWRGKICCKKFQLELFPTPNMTSRASVDRKNVSLVQILI